MLTVACIDEDFETVTIDFPREEITLCIYTNALLDPSKWTEFNKSFDDGLPRTIKIASGPYTPNIFFGYDNNKIVVTSGNDSYLKGTYLKTVIELSRANIHTIEQLEVLSKCVKNNTKYEWTDLPVSIKSARKN